MIFKFNEVINFERVGNKAEALIEMKKEGFNVPDGFVIDADTYMELIRHNGFEGKINNILEKMDKKNIESSSKEIINLLDTLVIPEKILDTINNLVKKNTKYAIRSSGIKEDLAEYSFAGQYDTFLNVDAKDISKKIVDCYKSMYSEVILSYLKNNNISLENLEMCVIVQEMVDSEKSGICFTINPITGKDKEMLIEVANGLGENIVSGKVVPEQYSYNWYDETFEIKKENKLLNKEIFEQMVKIFLDIQLYFGYPCDIEFAIYKEKIYILQARKITKIKYQGITDIWSTADFKDGGVSATICTPYMWSLYEYIWEYTLRKFILDAKILNKKDVDKKLGDMFYARCYWNLSVVKQAMSQVIGYKEREFDNEYGIKANYEGDGEVTKLTPKSIVKIIKMALAQKKILDERNKNAEKYKEDLLKLYEEYKLKYDVKSIENIKEVWYELTKKHYLNSESTYFWQIFINTIHQALYKGSLLKYVSESEYLTLLGSIEDISHLLPFYDMWNISRDIRKNKKEFEYWTSTTATKILEDIKVQTKKSFKSLKQIIDKYGYHSDKELDITYPCYYEDILPMIVNLKEMVILENKFSPIEDKQKGKIAYQKILKKISKKVSTKKYNKIAKKVSDMRKMLWWREEFRDISTRFYYILRIYTIEFAKELVKEGVLDNIEDIWFVKVEDLWNLVDGKKSKEEIEKIIAKNKIYYNSYKHYMSENEIGCGIVATEEKGKTNKIKGIGANNGIVTGTARVIESFDEIDRLEKDDILITKFTDTGWTPKFAILSGIVTEYGGILCHAAIVSREYGIPAIVNCSGVLSKIKDGQKILIDGAKGTVTILEK